MSATHAAASQQPDPGQLLVQLGTGYFATSALYATTKVGIPDMLSHGSHPVSELAEKTGLNEDALYRVMRLLASLGVYQEVGLRHFRLAPAAELLRTDHPQSMRDVVLWMGNPFHLQTYAELMHSLQTGAPCVERVTKMPVFDYFGKDPEVGREFHNGMTNITNMFVPPVLEAYDFSGIRTLVDVAGGHGMVSAMILQKYPEMHGIVYDLPQVVPGCSKNLQSLGVEGRCEARAGDMFESVPAGDSYVMKHIIHDWDDDRAVTILKNCAASMTDKNGRIILIEAVVTGGPEPDFAKVIDIEMLAMPGGRERTEDEFAELFQKAGLRLAQVARTKGPLSVVEARLA